MNNEAKFYNAVNLFCYSDYAKIQSLWERFGSWTEVWKNIKNNTLDPKKEWEQLKRLQIKLILQSDNQFPHLLKEIPLSPFGIYIKGNSDFTNINRIAIVGTRRASSQGRKIAHQLAFELSKQNLTIVSGLALGIDESSHWGSVENHAQTIAVLACGLDQIYPHQNKNLADKILSFNGALISEYPVGSPTLPFRFLERNRIISGLSLATIVVEAPFKSGAIATAYFALEQNREIFVVPGPINNKNYEGSHKLIKMGAGLITQSQDILENLSLPIQNKSNQASSQLTALTTEQKIILEVIENAGAPTTVDKILEITKLSPQTVNSSISFLMINDLAKESDGRYYI